MFITLIAILQAFSISLGVGSATLAVVNFFAAIADGTIDVTERRMIGIVYTVLRVATATLLVTTLVLVSLIFSTHGFAGFSPFIGAQLLTLTILLINSSLMSARLMTSTFGPAIQACSWYTLATLAALQSLQLTDFSFWQFILGYISWIVLGVGVVNALMFIQKDKFNRSRNF